MHRYKVIKGLHYDENGKEWKTGETFEGPPGLCTLFPGKFEDLGPVKEPKLVQNDPETETPSQEPVVKKVSVRKKVALPLVEEDWDKP